MAEISRYERVVLGLTAGFVLFTGAWFFANRSVNTPFVVTATPPQLVEQVMEKPAQEEHTQKLVPGEKININTANVLDLQRLPGIGEKRAQDIVEYRQAVGAFQSVEDLSQVSGIGAGIIAQLQEYVVLH